MIGPKNQLKQMKVKHHDHRQLTVTQLLNSGNNMAPILSLEDKKTHCIPEVITGWTISETQVSHLGPRVHSLDLMAS